VLLCYNYRNGITNEEEDIIFATKPELFSIGTINLFEIIQYVKTTYVEIMDTNLKPIISEQEVEVQSIKKKITYNGFEPRTALEDKAYPKTNYNHQPRNVIVDETPTRIKA
jgi:hypothetical protein